MLKKMMRDAAIRLLADIVSSAVPMVDTSVEVGVNGHRCTIAGKLHLASDSGQGIHHREDGEATLLLGDFQSLLGPIAADAVLHQDLGHFLGIIAKSLMHGLGDHFDEAVPAFIALGDKPLHDAAHFPQGIVDAGSVLSREFDDFDGVPDDVVLTNRLEPERLNAERAFAYFAVPDKNPGANAWPSISAQPVGWIRKQNMSGSPA